MAEIGVLEKSTGTVAARSGTDNVWKGQTLELHVNLNIWHW